MERGGKGEIKNWKRKRKGKGTGKHRGRDGKESRLYILFFSKALFKVRAVAHVHVYTRKALLIRVAMHKEEGLLSEQSLTMAMHLTQFTSFRWRSSQEPHAPN